MKRGDIIATIILFIVLVALSSCKTIKYVPVDKVSHDTITVYQTQRDSVVLHDSIYNEVIQNGDTIIKYKYVQKLQYKDRFMHDSIYISKTDTIPAPYAVERKQTIFERMKDKTWIILAILAFIEALTIYFLIKMR